MSAGGVLLTVAHDAGRVARVVADVEVDGVMHQVQVPTDLVADGSAGTVADALRDMLWTVGVTVNRVEAMTAERTTCAWADVDDAATLVALTLDAVQEVQA
ncbi:hypothetical protein [Cellulomonas sp. PSBB021]|uniref:hypothetical protein n=1 Tax=Cellulomonas sp. PSBB021 TaxID=2003551 RepID=UPI000B8DACF0|nr:hypothetical protein [Cellulomonas sp. PSBB021]ASR54194.1 hypothetical protein CBP52_02460 [Cellulomonas sp. PSBB021]